MIADHYRGKWSPNIPNTYPYHPGGLAPPLPDPLIPFKTQPTQNVEKDIAELRKEVQEMKELLKRAIKYDEDNNEPHCETKEKIEFLRKVAEAVGLNLDDVFGKESI